jgi:hypothetical protein
MKTICDPIKGIIQGAVMAAFMWGGLYALIVELGW